MLAARSFTSWLAPAQLIPPPTKAIKAFYMKIDEEESSFGGKSGQTVQGTDVLFPQIGEIIGGSVREESYDKLMGEIEARNIPMKDMNWYLDTRKYGSCPHAGFYKSL